MCVGGTAALTNQAALGPLMGIKSVREKSAKVVAKVTPDVEKQLYDKLMPDSVRKEVIKGGGGAMLANPESEAVEASNKATEEENRQKVQRAFAAKYNNQVKLL